ncbi:asparagine synthase (glutamine-hydrolyzing) [Bacillus carboniphilus]|uniref:asparagine synthase (glutamine-hydrolyzing) n=1 Tax=Bacillus carboniphilus TaxID=86663 RepID=A0ABY9JWN0_9BACI|nr:asparagine synthase (glutamine-hydrolyzing) [Bacillus carboniphilus]WLR42913.1 asparagine synthase (glutamine-hydrolyzing) [Bacillus carboniphilus]
MCGITGLVDFNQALTANTKIIEKMTNTLSKRGPDETNVWKDTHVQFGHKRLIVVDPEYGKQPMTREKNEHFYTICYNGELYNTEDIRYELKKRGYSFQGHSDTEVLLLSYIEWQQECVDFLNGIFAFSIWDHQKEMMFMARDRVGVKPLFYSEKNGILLFGSELKSILAHPSQSATLNEEGLGEVLGLGPSRSPGSGVFEGIDELRPGHALTYCKQGLKKWRYWNVVSRSHTHNLEETAGKVRELFEDTVIRQLVSDVPVCTFLSGGVDSSAISAITANHFKKMSKSLTTYSIDYQDNQLYFKENEFQPNNDEPWIDLMSDRFQTLHQKSIISQEQLFEHLQEAVIVRDLPGMADVDSSLLWFCKQIKKDFVVSLSGECADEIFGGYPWFHNPDSIHSDGFPWMRSTEERITLLQDKWQKRLKLDEYVKYRFQETLNETPALEGENHLEAKRRQLFYLNMVWFMTTLLDRKDRMSMGASLEVRVPFADHRLIEYVWNIPWEMKMYNGREKGILRKALEGILPEEILYRKKSPYPKTHHPQYTQLVKEWLQQALNRKGTILTELFHKEKIQGLIDTEGSSFKVPWFGQLMTGPQLLAYLAQLDYWFEHYSIDLNIK